MLQVRALRRQHYFKNLRNQQLHLIKLRDSELDFNTEDLALNRQVTNELLKIKKVRLIEDSIPYEDLAMMENFSDDEITIESAHKRVKENKDKAALKKVRKLEVNLADLKSFSVEVMKVMMDTLTSINKNSKKIVFKNFNQSNVNILAKQAPSLMEKIAKIRLEAGKKEKYDRFNSDDAESDSSGNYSDNDEVNMIQKFKR